MNSRYSNWSSCDVAVAIVSPFLKIVSPLLLTISVLAFKANWAPASLFPSWSVLIRWMLYFCRTSFASIDTLAFLAVFNAISSSSGSITSTVVWIVWNFAYFPVLLKLMFSFSFPPFSATVGVNSTSSSVTSTSSAPSSSYSILQLKSFALNLSPFKKLFFGIALILTGCSSLNVSSSIFKIWSIV